MDFIIIIFIYLCCGSSYKIHAGVRREVRGAACTSAAWERKISGIADSGSCGRRKKKKEGPWLLWLCGIVVCIHEQYIYNRIL